MTQQKDFLDRIRIASPCNVGWENMTGDDRTRFCDQCSLHVYNISAMTGDEVASLVAKTEGRLCARLYRRADGTVLTRDCPVGLHALRRRVSKAAGAALTALLSLCSVAAGQSKPQEDNTGGDAFPLKIKREAAPDNQSIFAGVVLDTGGAVVQGAEVTLVNEQTGQKLTLSSTPEGRFRFFTLDPGEYSFEITADGFKPRRSTALVINPREVVLIDVTLEFEGNIVVVGIMSDPTIIPETKDDFKISNGTTTIRGEMIQRLPIP